MASSTTMSCVSEMVEVRANGLKVPIFKLVDENGVASLYVIHLDMKFSLIKSSIWMEREIYNYDMFLLSFTLHENLKFVYNGSVCQNFSLTSTVSKNSLSFFDRPVVY